jgi:hypothetical protein
MIEPAPEKGLPGQDAVVTKGTGLLGDVGLGFFVDLGSDLFNPLVVD